MSVTNRWSVSEEPSSSEAAPAPSPASTEKDLLLSHRRGDPRAFGRFVESYKSAVFGFLVRYGVPPCDREDLFQEIFIRIHVSAHRFEAHRALHPWVFTIVVNTTRSYFRACGRRPVLMHGDTVTRLAAAAPSAERILELRERLARLERAIPELPEKQRETLLLAVGETLSMREIAEVMQAPVGTVKTWLRRARTRLVDIVDRGRT